MDPIPVKRVRYELSKEDETSSGEDDGSSSDDSDCIEDDYDDEENADEYEDVL